MIFKIQHVNILFKWKETVNYLAAAVARSGILFAFFVFLMLLSSERMYYNIERIKILGTKLRNFHGDWSAAGKIILGAEYQISSYA